MPMMMVPVQLLLLLETQLPSPSEMLVDLNRWTTVLRVPVARSRSATDRFIERVRRRTTFFRKIVDLKSNI